MCQARRHALRDDPRLDIVWPSRQVRFVPNRKSQALLDHPVRAGEKGRRDFDAERFRRLNDKQEFGGLENPPWIGQHRERSDEAA
jgi:hypothetical protein